MPCSRPARARRDSSADLSPAAQQLLQFTKPQSGTGDYRAAQPVARGERRRRKRGLKKWCVHDDSLQYERYRDRTPQPTVLEHPAKRALLVGPGVEQVVRSTSRTSPGTTSAARTIVGSPSRSTSAWAKRIIFLRVFVSSWQPERYTALEYALMAVLSRWRRLNVAVQGRTERDLDRRRQPSGRGLIGDDA